MENRYGKVHGSVMGEWGRGQKRNGYGNETGDKGEDGRETSMRMGIRKGLRCEQGLGIDEFIYFNIKCIK